MNGQKGDLKEQGIMRKPTDLMVVVVTLLAYGLEDALARSLDERPPVKGCTRLITAVRNRVFRSRKREQDEIVACRY